MKNIHILPTIKKQSRIIYSTKYNKYMFCYENPFLLEDKEAQHKIIHITSDEEIKEGDWYLNTIMGNYHKATKEDADKINNSNYSKFSKKIIMTIDSFLINDGVQAIDDEFLEWFVDNPNCQEVRIENAVYVDIDSQKVMDDYNIIIPKETSIMVAAENHSSSYYDKTTTDWHSNYNGFISGAQWILKERYTEEEMMQVWRAGQEYWKTSGSTITFEELIEQIKLNKK